MTQSNEIDEIELTRLIAMNEYEKKARKNGFKYIAGIDEAGRGPLAGPVVAAACIIPEGIYIPEVNDSKQLTEEKRDRLYEQIIKDKRIQFGVGVIDSDEIDRINILQATIAAMIMAVEKLTQKPDYLLVDGLKLPHPEVDSEKIIKGDAKSQSIAAASVIAKVTRDRLMYEYHNQWPQYGFNKHKGYGTARHKKALDLHGPIAIHRKTFEPIKSFLLNLSLS